jgi:hypothetical protein
MITSNSLSQGWKKTCLIFEYSKSALVRDDTAVVDHAYPFFGPQEIDISGHSGVVPLHPAVAFHPKPVGGNNPVVYVVDDPLSLLDCLDRPHRPSPFSGLLSS